ncbi:hypothetical protein H0E84_14490 [Luteimonas sp. SJ-92]|uniref:Uncharacterized protein n=1 Tax=Luteimonas salinisoli TaxID=2752307 RepID=A0A853JFF9_9GAMM|nr:hypothetical protein [Luteimonas salinisoli]NZA27585.1 hypothetical protein [Luteimonas salinisoli]
MKRLLIASALLGMAFAVAAQDDEPEERTAAGSDRGKAAERYCITETGSRVVASRNARNKSEREACVAAGGRVYTRAELESTGSVDLADALRRLDPSIR